MSSDDDSVSLTDAFGLANIPATKKVSTPRDIVPDAAPHVLAEVPFPALLSAVRLTRSNTYQDPLHQSSLVTRPTDTQMNVNIPYPDMIMPLQGPENPFGDRNRFVNQNALAGHVEEQAMSDHAFKAQHLTHAILGFSANPSVDPAAPSLAGSLDSARAHAFTTIDALRPSNAQKRVLKRKRKHRGALDVVDGDGAYLGPWASWDGEDQAGFLDGVEEASDPDHDLDHDHDHDQGQPEPAAPRKKAKPKRGALGQESSVFHGKSMTDYQGRTYMHPPLADAPHLTNEAGSQDTFLPKACIHTWTGHTQGVSAIRLFPDTGHLLLSGSMDTKIKVCLPLLSPSCPPHPLSSSGTCTPTAIVFARSTATSRPSRTSPFPTTANASFPAATIVR